MHRHFIMSDIIYTTKQDGISIERSINTNSGRLNSDYGFFFNKVTGSKMLGKDHINNSDGSYGLFKFVSSLRNLFHERDKHNFIMPYGFSAPEAYPAVVNGKYFLAVFGSTEGALRDACTSLHDGNIVALVAYNPDNYRDDICVLTRPNQRTRSCLYPEE